MYVCLCVCVRDMEDRERYRSVCMWTKCIHQMCDSDRNSFLKSVCVCVNISYYFLCCIFYKFSTHAEAGLFVVLLSFR